MADPNPGLDGASEGAEDLELEPGESTLPENGESGTKEPGGDPLDDIKDEVARAEAKKHRSIARRVDGKEKPEHKPEEQKPTVSSQEFLTKADFYKANERKAIKQAIADPEIKAHWAEIIPFFSSRHGKETPEDILEDIQDAITLYKVRNPKTETDDSALDLTATPVVKTGGGIGDKKQIPKVKDPPNFKLPSQPKDWYKKPSV